MRFHSGMIGVGLALCATGAQAQLDRATLVPRAGYTSYAEASGIEPSAFVGVDLNYTLANFFGLGASLEVSRPTTRGEDFITQLRYGDTTFLFAVIQPITVLTTALNARAEFGTARFTPFATAGVGLYKVYLDPQAAGGHDTFQGMLVNVGGGINFMIRDGIGIQLDVRDHIYTGYDRDDLNPIDPQFRVTRFIDDVPAPPEEKDSIHNLVFSIGFSFRPSRTGGNGGN